MSSPTHLPARIPTGCLSSRRGPRREYQVVIPADQRWVAAAPFRTAFRLLVDATGLPWRMVAGLAHVPTGVAARLVIDPPAPRHRLRQVDAQRLCLLTPQAVRSLRRTKVPAATARRRLRRLERHHSRNEIARLTGVGRPELDQLIMASTIECSALTARLLQILEHEVQESSVGPVSDDAQWSGQMPAAA